MSGSSSLNFSCKDEKYKGFDLQAGKTWIYPTNYPLRDYQYNIIQDALLNNTLVSLPTGLGKTFIAAVVMYNFYRWYPNGKIIFMAPTRPLVKQQIDACYNIMAIPKETTAELTGSNAQDVRTDIWKEKRVFFVTAQVLSNDLDRIAELGPKIKCLVFDEAHRAKGNYAYCLVIRKLLPKTKNFRVLALSATPGNNIADVEEVVQNLLISHIALRTEESPDVVPYTFKKNMETVVVPIGKKLTEIRELYIEILEKYTRVLLKHRVIQGNCRNLTKGKIFLTLKEFQERNRTTRCEAYSEIVKNLNICITLYHGFELLIRHGLRGFLSFFEEHSEKPLLRGNAELFAIMRDVSEYLGPPPDISPLPDGTTPEIPENTRFGHPKFYKLCDILLAHFTQHQSQSSRVIVFCEYRESVMEAYALLLQQKPLIKPKVFIGQGAITQRQQLNVIQSFIQGECNTLISTCIGEEGLDVGEVDLIVCFDISNKSPVRMIQRIGRTGRKRDGRVVILVTEGKEEETLKACLLQKNYMSKTILGSPELAAKLYKENSRMIPDDIVPECMKINISVKKEVKVKNETIKSMFSRMENALTQGSSKKEYTDLIPDAVTFWDKNDPLQLNNPNESKINFSKHLEMQRKLQPTGIIDHSKESDLLVSLLQFADSKRFNLPMTQDVLLSQFTQVPKQKSKLQKTNGYKQADLRSMLFKASATSDASSEEAVINQKIFDYLQSIRRIPNTCKICENFFDCTHLQTKDELLKINEWFIPDFQILDCINNESLEAFKKTLDPFSEEIPEFPEPEDKFSKNNSIAFELPKGFDDVVRKCDSTFFENVDFTQLEKNANKIVVAEDPEEVLRFFKLNSLENLFQSSQESNLFDETIIYEPEQDTVAERLSPVLTKTQKEREEEGSPILCSYERIKFLKDRAQKKLFACEQDGLTQVNAKPRLSNLVQKKQNSFYVPKSANKTQRQATPEEARRKAALDDSLFEAFDTTFCAKEETGKIEDIDDIFDTSFLSQNNKKDTQKGKSAEIKEGIFDTCTISGNNKKTVTTSKSQNLQNCKEESLLTIGDIDDIFDTSFLSRNNKKGFATSDSQNLKAFSQKRKFAFDSENKKNVSTKESQRLKKFSEKHASLKLEDIDDIFDTSFLSTNNKKVVAANESQNSKTYSQKRKFAFDSESNKNVSTKKSQSLKKFGEKDESLKLEDIDDIFDTTFLNTNNKKEVASSNSQNLKTFAQKGKFALGSENNKNVSTKESQSLKKFSEKHASLKLEDIDDIFDTSFLSKTNKKAAVTSEPQDLKTVCQKGKPSTSVLRKQSNKKPLVRKSEISKPAKINILSDIDDICDVSVFATTSTKETKKPKNGDVDDLLDIADICDIATLISEDKPKEEPKNQDAVKKKGGDINNLLDLDDICDISMFKPSKFSLKTQSTEKEKQELTKAALESTKLESQKRSSKTATKTQELETTNHVKPTIQNKSSVEKKRSPVCVNSKTGDDNKAQNERLDSVRLNKTQFSQDSLADFDDSCFSKGSKTPKKLRLSTTSKTKNTDSILKKYLPDYNQPLCEPVSSTTTKVIQQASKTKNTNSVLKKCVPEHNKTLREPATADKSTSQQSQYTITQILNIINRDDTKASSSTLKSSTHKKDFDSEDEFETHKLSKSRPKSALLTPKSEKNTKSMLKFESDDEFEVPLSPKLKRKNPEKFKKPKKKLEANPYIELEAEVSDEEGVTVSDDESVADDDCLDSSFVNDETQVFNNTQMHGHYLQSVRSPKTSKGFKIPKLPKLKHSEVFSQPVVDLDNTYLNDTFCVESEGLSEQDTEPCELEIAERILQEERKRKRQKKAEKLRKRRVLRISDDSD